MKPARMITATPATPNVLGVLDWGIGGLGVVRTLHRAGVSVPIVYLSDSGARAYGKLSRIELTARVQRVVDALAAHNATHVLVACNAASTVVPTIRSPLPITEMITPTLQAMTALPRPHASQVLRIGVIGGARTIRSGCYLRGLRSPHRVVIQRIAQPLSGHIEAGTFDTPAAQADLQRILAPLSNVDRLVLACTHYPAIATQIQPLVPNARLIDPADAVTCRLAANLQSTGSATDSHDVTHLCTGDPNAMRAAATRAWGVDPGPCRHVAL